MKSTLVLILFVLATSSVAVAYSHQLFLDLPIAESIGGAGLSAYRLDLSTPNGSSLAVGRGITDRLDVWMSACPSDLFSLRVRALLVDHLGPLSMSLDFSQDGFTLLSALYLGPVEIDWGRIFGPDGKRWVAITTSPNQFCSLLFGVQYSTNYSPVASLRIFPRRGVWALSLYYRGGEWGASIGGTI